MSNPKESVTLNVCSCKEYLFLMNQTKW